MTKIDSVTNSVKTWKELKDAIHTLQNSSQYIWRGHSSSKWELNSALFRYFEKNNISNELRDKIENQSFNYFKKNVRENQELEEFYSKDRIQFSDTLIIMQNYGCPTRLIDFSMSPYIATYFTLENTNGKCALYGIDLTKYLNILKKEIVLDDYNGELLSYIPKRIFKQLYDNQKLVKPIPFKSSPITKRDLYQQSVFLIDMDISSSAEDILLKENEDILVKFVFPFDICIDIQKDLELMNIDGFHLFQGLNGLSYKAKDLLIRTDLIEQNGDEENY